MLTEKEQGVVDGWKKRKIIRHLLPEEATCLTENGGVFVVCSDGLIDACCHAHACIHQYANPFRVFGGPLIWAKSYQGYRESFAYDCVENIIPGMMHKKTSSCFKCFHAPCGMLKKYEHALEELEQMTHEAVEFVRANGGADLKIYPLFHTRKWVGREEQNTYMFVL